MIVTRIRANTAWNFFGLAAPLAVAAVAVPRLISALGADAFGLLTLAWSAIGYFSFLDLGLGRALSQTTAADLAADAGSRIPARFWTSLHLMALIGVAGAAVMAPAIALLAGRFLHLPPALADEGRRCLWLLAAAVPVLTTSAGLRGFLEAHQRFAAISAVRTAMGLLTFGLPLALLPYTHDLAAFVAVLVLARLAGLAAYFVLAMAARPGLLHAWSPALTDARALLRLGGWMTVSNVVSPLMTYLDRFLIGAIVAMSAVAYYATPFEVATKMLLFSGALTGVLFPAFSGTLAADRTRAEALYRRSLAGLAVALGPVALALAVFGKLGMTLWLGTDFSSRTGYVLPILSLGVFLNGAAGIPFAFVQAAGRPDLTAKLHLVEAPVYLLGCWLLTRQYGIDGAAAAWALRALGDGLALIWIARRWTKRDVLGPVVPAFVGHQ